jgi:hypothetical protein
MPDDQPPVRITPGGAVDIRPNRPGNGLWRVALTNFLVAAIAGVMRFVDYTPYFDIIAAVCVVAGIGALVWAAYQRWGPRPPWPGK